MSIAIKVENLSKIYQIGEIGTGTLSRDMERWWVTKVMGKEDPFLKIGQTNDRSKKGEGDVVYSLQDINFEIEQGDAVGIIGKNGAGKSTLLKILSRITSPTTGKIQVKGRVASLLEVGTGFHPELTGRDNIYLNGAILGMRKREITRKLDEIIDFSGVERYIDTPVKRYSSGMYVRLAFAVAAHLESEILIVDEVLAVGDAEFQKKCLGKMGEVSKGEGRTVLFVSHNMFSVKSLCTSVILLDNGAIKKRGNTDLLIADYLGHNVGKGLNLINQIIKISNDLLIKKMVWKNHEKEHSAPIIRDLPIVFEIEYDAKSNHKNVYFVILIKDVQGNVIINTNTFGMELFKKGNENLRMTFPTNYLNDGQYFVDIYILKKVDKIECLFYQADILTFDVLPEERIIGDFMGNEPGIIRQIYEWEAFS